MRQQIVRAAARRFRSGGSEGVPIAGLMKDLALTHGGFYRHFAGKEALFDEALVESGSQVETRMMTAAEQAPPGRELEGMINTYLSAWHCANPGEGCPIAALATEVARHPKGTRATLGRVAQHQAAVLARFMPGRTQAERERTALVLFAGMAGTLNLARAIADETLRGTVLENARAFYIQAVRGMA